MNMKRILPLLLSLAMALALGLYMLAGHCALKPLFARPRPCDLRPEMLTLVARPHGWSFPSGHTSSAFAAAFALWLPQKPRPCARRGRSARGDA